MAYPTKFTLPGFGCGLGADPPNGVGFSGPPAGL